MDKTNKIPQAVIDELQPQEGYSYAKYLCTFDDTDYYCLSYYEDVIVGLPLFVGYQNGKTHIVPNFSETELKIFSMIE